MSNNEKQPTPVEWLRNQITFQNEFNQIYFQFTEETELNDFFKEAKAMEDAREKELIQQYEKKISHLLDRLILKQDEVIAILQQQQNPIIKCGNCNGHGEYTNKQTGVIYHCKKCNGSGYVKIND